MTARTPSTAEVIQRAVSVAFARAHTCHPARVEKYDAAKQLVNVQPLLLPSYEDETGARILDKPLPVVTNVPVVFPGAGGFRLTFPIQAGDTVLLVFAERSIDTWLAKGGQVDPADDRTHDLSDAIAIPGLNASADVWTGASTSAITFGKDGGAQIEIGPAAIKLGLAAVDALIKGTTYRAAEATANAQLAAQFTALGAAMTALAGAAATIIPPPAALGVAAAAGAAATAAAALAAAVTSFEGQAATFLSNLSKTE